MTLEKLQTFARENELEFVDIKVSNLAGRWHHITIPIERFTQETLDEGIGFDASSYGFAQVEKSDLVIIPDLETAKIDPFLKSPTLSLIGNVFDPVTMERFEGDPRYICHKGSEYLKESGFGDTFLIAPEFEFHIFDSFSQQQLPYANSYFFESKERGWPEAEPSGYQLGKKGYHADIPLDHSADYRSHVTRLLQNMGVEIKYHHHEGGGSGQAELEVELGELERLCDHSFLIKYVLKNTAREWNKSVTFLPKPLYNEAGNGMHVHMQVLKNGENVFYDEKGYAGLSDEALHFIGGLLKHGPALLGLTNPTTNSYRRLVPGFEAPISLVFALANRSAVIRIPGYANSKKAKRFEFRSSDATCNPYLAFTAMLMAGIDGMKKKIDPTEEGFGPYDKNIYELSPEEQKKIRTLPTRLEDALDALEADHDFLLEGGVFNDEILASWIAQKREEAKLISLTPHPEELRLYYDL